MTPEQKQRNRKTGLILLSVALVFFVGIVVRKIMEPSILNLMQ
ncbi:cytochrome oxidase small assembly protein [Limnobacter humi]|uniref:Cytochrome oxidase small assembly protein n=1 Tax=Limnobacter humi TaxID=1778671 RepID=A0ABT1WJJ7_9BURK|nr:cytochrome oxidase small assembly protein [Limnobacter humi]